MYRRKARYGLSVWLTLVMLFVMFFPAPADAQYKPLEWTTVDKPGLNNYIIISPSEVNRIAVGNSGIVYAIDSCTITSGITGKLYRSSNGGLSWSDITANVPSTDLPLTEIACAADNPKYVAIVTKNRDNVYFSNDTGDTWNNMGITSITGTAIQCITFSPGYQQGTNQFYDIAIGTAKWGGFGISGQILTCQIGALVSAWKDQSITSGMEISSIAFSPNYRSDGTILVVVSTGSGVSPATKTLLCIGKRDLVVQTTLWNTSAGYTGYPVDIAPGYSNGDAAGVERIISSLGLPSDYVGTDSTKRKVFVSYNIQPDSASAGDGVFRLDDTTPVRFGTGALNLSSISYYGTLTSGKLLAGEANPNSDTQFPNTVQVWRSLDPLILSPSLLKASYPPSGPPLSSVPTPNYLRVAQVSWATDGSMAYCGTGHITSNPLDESAFSQSNDNGDTWIQTSLIDTAIKATDIAVEPDSRSLFLATYSSFGPEGVWRTTAEPLGNFWGRILSLNTKSDRLILRVSPNYAEDYTLYAIEAEGNQSNQLAVSHTRGNTWQNRLIPGPVADVAVVSRDVLYVGLPDGRVRKSLNGGMVWEAPVSTGLDAINMITLSQNGHLFVGSRDGKVAYSTDEGKSFRVIPKPLGNTFPTGDVQVVTDANYINNSSIYAATSNADEGVWRWTIGISTEWEQVDKQITDRGTGECFSGLKVGTEGTLYALRSEQVDINHTKGGMNRSLNAFSQNIEAIEFDTINRTLDRIPDPPNPDKEFPQFNPLNPISLYPHVMPWLKISGNTSENQLWSIHPIFSDNKTVYKDFTIYRFVDNICKAGPATKPTGDIGCDPVSGRSQEVNFLWEQLSIANAYEMKIAKDKDFTQIVHDSGIFYLEAPTLMSPAYIYFTTTGGGLVALTGPDPCAGGTFKAADQIPLECGHLYYWKVRIRNETSCETVRSPWSATKAFTIKAGFRVTTPYYGPQLLAPDNGCGCPCDAPLCFSWSPFKETSRYLFEVYDNSDLSNPLVSRNVNTTAYQYTGRISCNKNYFWRVRAAEPSPSEWSATFSFKTSAAAPQQHTPPAQTGTPLWVWGIITCGLALWICIFILVLRRKRQKEDH